MDTRGDQPPEGLLIEEARERLRISQNEAAKRAGMSGTRWRQIVYGKTTSGGVEVPVHGNAKAIARMARVVQVSDDQLTEAGRGDAGTELTEILRKELDTETSAIPDDPEFRRILDLWPQTAEWQRRSFVGILENMISGTSAPSAESDTAHDKRRTG